MSEVDTPALLDVERRTGRTFFTVHDWAAIRQKAVETLTDADLIVIQAFEGEKKAEALKTVRQRAHAPSPPTSAPRVKSSGMSKKTLEMIADGVAMAIHAAVVPLVTRISDMEQRIGTSAPICERPDRDQDQDVERATRRRKQTDRGPAVRDRSLLSRAAELAVKR